MTCREALTHCLRPSNPTCRLRARYGRDARAVPRGPITVEGNPNLVPLGGKAGSVSR